MAILATKQKILAKLSVVAVLTLNGVAIHFAVFPAFRSRKSFLRYVPVLSVFASISIVSWLYAAFVGIAKPLTNLPGNSGFIEIYALLPISGIVTSFKVVLPMLGSLKVVYPTFGQKSEPVMKRLVDRFNKKSRMEAATTLLYPM